MAENSWPKVMGIVSLVTGWAVVGAKVGPPRYSWRSGGGGISVNTVGGQSNQGAQWCGEGSKKFRGMDRDNWEDNIGLKYNVLVPYIPIKAGLTLICPLPQLGSSISYTRISSFP